MLNLLSKTAQVLAEATLGALAVAALAVCLLAWRLGQGPMDVTPLLHREHALFESRGARASVGHATLALDRFGLSGALLRVAAQDVAAASDDGGLQASVRQACVSLSVPQLLLGRVRPREIDVEGGEAVLRVPSGQDLPPRAGGAPPRDAVPDWLTGLQHVRVHGLKLTMRGAAPGLDVVAPRMEAELERHGEAGVTGSARLDVQAGTAHGTVELQAALRPGGTALTLTATPVSPAALAGLLPALAPLAAADLPVAVHGQAELGPGFGLQAARVELAAGAGALHVGRGSVAVAAMAATLSARPGEATLDALRIALAPAGRNGPPPVITARASARRQPGRTHAEFTLTVDGMALADLPAYWPEGAGTDARTWLTQNVTAGHAHDAQVRGTLDGAADASDMRLVTVSGGLLADDVSLTWLRPIPGLVHGRARVVLESPDALTVTMERGGEQGLVLQPGSSIRITGLSAVHQFGDIAVGLSGTLPDALGLLNHPRLHLLDRGGLQVVGAAGQVAARLTLRVPLEARVTMDQIPIAASATLTGVHLGRIAAGRDLDGADLSLDVTGEGLSAAGTGTVSGIPARLGLAMDFRDGGPDQVLQHVTAAGSATAAALGQAGLPDGAVHLMTGGETGLRVEYTGRRDGSAALQVDADLTRAALGTPVGWSKAAGQPAALGALVLLDHGRLAGVDHVHLEGPGLAVASRTQAGPAARTLLLDRLEVGATRAHGQVSFPASPGAPVQVKLAGPMLDLSSQLAPAPSRPVPAAGPDAPQTRGQPWAASLAFDRVGLARGKVLSPFTLDAASDGLHILHAHASAGAQGELAVDITPEPGGRSLAVAAADAGAALRALGVADNLAGGRLVLDGRYDDTQQGAPLSGTATLTEFNLRTAPAIGRLLQAMTLYGLADVLRGPGLHFSRLVAPFGWHDRVLHLANARAFSPSLGITAQGDIDLRRRVADVKGTVVPAYFFNQLLGDLPLIGRVFSPEKGGGVFAARYAVRGPLGDPKVGVNPLSALTPGFLREGFGLFSPRRAAGQ